VSEAGEALRAGLLVVIPTDTVYGLAADPSVPGATDRIFAAKRRGHDLPLPVLVDDIHQARGVAAFTPIATRLAARFWPGPLTIVVRRATGDDTVGLRAPDHDIARALCREVGPLATTSANLHGEPTPETAAEVAAVFGDLVAVVVDGGPCTGAPSTVVDCTGDGVTLIREGRLAFAEVVAATRET
jgi:tRNA threonylcarbamoyl adenosine modification protein (Sua5/YciO/YrdC/YwlC family)